MKKVKCIKGLLVDKYDDDGFNIENEHCHIEEDTIWNMEEGSLRIADGEVRLTSDKWGWLEIPKEMFEECFEEIS